MLSNVWEYYMPPFCVAGDLYFVGNKRASSHLLDTGEGLLLLDSGYAQTLYLLMDSIRELGFSPHDICWILHTHGHIDHLGATRALVELTGAKTFIGREDLDYATGLRDLTFAREMGMTFTETFQPDVLLKDKDVLRFGNTEITCLHTPGHTEGTMSYFFYVEHNGKSYRVGTHGGVGLNTMKRQFLECYKLPFTLREDFCAGLRRLHQEHVDIFIGNHQDQCDTIGKSARILGGERDAFVDPTAWGSFLHKMEEKLNAMIKEEQEEIMIGEK